ncbi:MAG: hypothetical protein QNJ48_05190 [Desulfobacterales bacterium]|nr:hypothetical protein [Desulfobacterales bacterium]
MTNAHTFSVLKQILGAGDQAAHARFLEAIGDMTIRPAVLRNTYPIKTLLWRYNDLKPHVREGLEADLRDRWQAYIPEDLEDTDRSKENNPPPTARPEPTAPIPARYERNVFPPAVARREDAFDRFLGWLACLLGR